METTRTRAVHCASRRNGEQCAAAEWQPAGFGPRLDDDSMKRPGRHRAATPKQPPGSAAPPKQTGAGAGPAKQPIARVGPVNSLRDAIQRHRAGDLAAAEAAYAAHLAAAPDDPDALHYLGVLRHQQQRTDEGIALVRRALDVSPRYVDAWSNLGNLHKEFGRLEEAEDAYRHAIAIDRDHVGSWNNLGVVLRAQGKAADAVTALRHALERAPGMADAWFNLGNALRSCGTLQGAITAYRRVLALRPTHAYAQELLGRVLYVAGDRDQAATVFREWAAREPDNPVPAHMLAACSGVDVPARASDAYVRTTFDHFAASFDEVLLHRLEYRAPEVLCAALADVLEPPQRSLDVLDAGCGTGLCGPLLQPYAQSLTGVDLSGGMLARARARAVYDRLVEDEIVRFLMERPAHYDVVVSADTLCYFGDLASVLHVARGALRPQGWLAFTLERADDVDAYRINPHGRYSHARTYVASLLAETRFERVSIEPASLRLELGKPVEGWVVRAGVAA
jgi:predicted TPR repeat methyltransferase